MEQSSKNENTCDIFMNEVRMEDEPQPKLEKYESLQTKRNRNLEMNVHNLKKLHAQRVFWRTNSRNALCYAFHCVNDSKKS